MASNPSEDDPCPFCRIATAYPAFAGLQDAVPLDPDATKVDPNCFLLLNTYDVMAFLDILPMTRGHVLLATREHRPKLADVAPGEGCSVGMSIHLF